MINTNNLIYDGRVWNYQNGLTFSINNRGTCFSFLVAVVGDKKRTVRVTMHPDVNHARPHVHINEHGASFAIDNGELLAGACDNKTRKLIEDWIARHREDLEQLWDIVKRGERYESAVKRIKQNRSFEDYGFGVKEPKHKTVISGVTIWHDDDILVEDILSKTIIIGTGNIYVALPESFDADFMDISSLDGDVHKKKVTD